MGGISGVLAAPGHRRFAGIGAQDVTPEGLTGGGDNGIVILCLSERTCWFLFVECVAIPRLRSPDDPFADRGRVPRPPRPLLLRRDPWTTDRAQGRPRRRVPGRTLRPARRMRRAGRRV